MQKIIPWDTISSFVEFTTNLQRFEFRQAVSTACEFNHHRESEHLGKWKRKCLWRRREDSGKGKMREEDLRKRWEGLERRGQVTGSVSSCCIQHCISQG